jgi:hypothetical protein
MIAFILLTLIASCYLIFQTITARRRSLVMLTQVSAFSQSVRNLLQATRFGSSITAALLGLESRSELGSGYLKELVGALNKGLGYPEGVRIARKSRLTVLDGFVDLVCGRADQSHPAVIGGLEKVSSLFRLVLRNLRQERARTNQSRMQFWVIAILVPCLFAFNLVSFPHLVANALRDSFGLAIYLSALLFYLVGIALFFKLQGQGFSFFVEPQKSHAKQQSRLKSSKSEAEASRLGFLCAVELALHSGMGLQQALQAACELFPQADFAKSAERVLQLESRGELLSRSFRILESKNMTQAEETLIEIGHAARERTLLCEVVSGLVSDSREVLAEISEEQVGAVSVQLLFPLCLGMLPAALLVLLAPIVQMLVATFSNG